MYENKKLFTIGQFAALHEINKKTLMWYDEIDLFKPAVIKENGYRYYTYQQSSVLETILMLRELNVSLPEIQDFMKNRSAASLEVLLNEKINELDQTIAHLQAVRKMLSHHQQDMLALLNMDLTQINIIEKEKRYLVTVHTTPDVPLEKEIEKVIAQTKKYQLRRLHDASYGSMIPVENLYCGRFEDYTELYIELPGAAQKKGLHVQPKGKYLQAFCKGGKDKIPAAYEALLNYAREHSLTLYDYAYEMGINVMVIDDVEDYITKIEIPILHSS